MKKITLTATVEIKFDIDVGELATQYYDDQVDEITQESAAEDLNYQIQEWIDGEIEIGPPDTRGDYYLIKKVKSVKLKKVK